MLKIEFENGESNEYEKESQCNFFCMIGIVSEKGLTQGVPNKVVHLLGIAKTVVSQQRQLGFEYGFDWRTCLFNSKLFFF